LQDLINYKEGKLLDKQQASLKMTASEQNQAIIIAKRRLEVGLNSLKYAHKFYSRDSSLFLKKVISEAELDKSEVAYNNSKDNYQSYLNNLTNARQQVQMTQNKIQEINIQNPEKEKEVRSHLVSTYNDLLDNIKIWEQKYVFKAPLRGRVQFLRFWTNNQYIQAGEQIFTIVPKNNIVIGQVTLPSNGAGKVKVGQEVIVKLDDYPFNEYGSVKGFVKSISLTTNTIRTEKGDIDNYLVTVDFPNQLKTSYGSKLDFKFESKGTAEIIANDRRFIERLFDNLKYITQ
jgi:multidrug resistance efflux pump